MKCNECFKELNEMTLYCDRCGAQVSKEKIKLNFAVIEKTVIPLQIESEYKIDQVEEIKKAYFLSNIKSDFKGFKRRYIEQYIDYVLLRVYYEKNKVLLTTNDYDKERALALLETFENRKPHPIVLEILKEEYGDDYENKVIPKSITDKIESIYCTNFSLRLLSPSRFLTRILITTFFGVIKMAVVLGLVGAMLYIGLPMIMPGFDLLSILQGNQYVYLIIGCILLILGYISSRKERFYYPFEDIVNSNSTFKRHIKNTIKKRSKTLRYRIKKDGKKKK